MKQKTQSQKVRPKIRQRNISQIKEQDKTQAEQLGEVETGNFIEYAKLFDCVDHTKLWKILKEMGIPDRWTCLLRNLYAGQEATVRIGHGTIDWFQIGKEVRQGCILSPCLFKFYAEYIMRNAGLEEAQAGIKIAREISITSDMLMIPPLGQKVKRS